MIKIKLNTTSMISAVADELKHLKGNYVMTPCGIGCSFNEFKSVYCYDDEAERIVVLRYDNYSVVVADNIPYKVF